MSISNRSPEEIVWQSITSLDSWLTDNGWAGYDPYDLKGTKLYVGLINQGAKASLPAKAVRKALIHLEDHYPLFSRRLLRMQKQINAKGMGLFARGYLDLYLATGEECFKEKALVCLEWLRENPSPDWGGPCWGYPFDWQSVIFIPKGTPSAVVSSVVGDAFWRAYEVLADPSYLDLCEGICQFFLSDLNIDEMEDGAVCFSYTPLDDFHVHNANLFVAEFLTRVGMGLSKREYLDWGQRAAAYALQDQNPDGSLYYWGKIQNHHSPDHIDHYHSGFEIRSLYHMWKWTGDPAYFKAVENYYGFYLENLISKSPEGTLLKMKADAIYPIDIHSCAEALLCNGTLAEDFKEARALLPELAAWILSNMQTKDGWFIYQIRDRGKRKQQIEIPYLRWGQAWMLRALASVYQIITSE
jgi:hypothetical protein